MFAVEFVRKNLEKFLGLEESNGSKGRGGYTGDGDIHRSG